MTTYRSARLIADSQNVGAQFTAVLDHSDHAGGQSAGRQRAGEGRMRTRGVVNHIETDGTTNQHHSVARTKVGSGETKKRDEHNEHKTKWGTGYPVRVTTVPPVRGQRAVELSG
jgi:hypothetical protein